ncbi:MAG TPA: efflux RND transporter periplasmic adaptor subunit [Gemmatimonadales bacterium]|jgi:RND family efflux transporter MFP subunit
MNPSDPERDAEPGTHADPHPQHVDVGAAPPVRPASGRLMLAIGVGVVALLIILYVAVLLPRRALARELVTDASQSGAPPTVQVMMVHRGAAGGRLELPGTIEALHEGAIYARVAGYVKRWTADIGSTVHAGEVLAEIDAPELAQNVDQARAQLAQVQASLGLARGDLARWKELSADSAVSSQELDEKQAAYDAAVATTAAAKSNLQRLTDLEGYTHVRAPFTGVITARNVDIGSLITTAGATSAGVAGGEGAGTGGMFRLAQTDTVRAYLPVPESYAVAIHAGLQADVRVQELPGKTFVGRTVRTSHAIDAGSRTMLTEVDIANPGFRLLPGMYATVTMQLPDVTPPLVIPATALVIRSDGPEVMVVDRTTPGSTATVHLEPVQIGRDYGATVEILAGVADGATVVLSPGAEVTERSRVIIGSAPSDSTRQ